jgi:hypothetical protein
MSPVYFVTQVRSTLKRRQVQGIGGLSPERMCGRPCTELLTGRSMLGSDYFRWRTSQFITPIPWIPAAAFVGIAALLTMIAIYVVQRRDF